MKEKSFLRRLNNRPVYTPSGWKAKKNKPIQIIKICMCSLTVVSEHIQKNLFFYKLKFYNFFLLEKSCEVEIEGFLCSEL